ncbi:hypothetical protein ACOMHN_007561 [Nucella lapillus]
MNPHQQPGDRHTENSEGLSAGGEQGEGGGCMGGWRKGEVCGGVTCPPSRHDPVNCQPFPDLFHASVLF